MVADGVLKPDSDGHDIDGAFVDELARAGTSGEGALHTVRLSYLVATARAVRILLIARSTALRCLYISTSRRGGRPPRLPLAKRPATWFDGAGIVAVMPRRCR